jgi:glycosyltransferase involved in cell wall biosynthesis
MKIVLLGTRTSIHTVRWANSIANRGIEVHLITMHTVTRGNPLAEGVQLYTLPFKSPAGYYLNYLALRRLLHKIKPDILHAFYVSGYGTLARLSKFHPLAVSVLGSDVFDFPGESFFHRKLIEKNLEAADHIFSTSHIMAREASQYVNKPITVIPFGVNLDIFKPRKVASIFDEESIVIGTIKTLEEKYGIEYLIRSFKIVRERHPNAPLKLLIVGSGSLKERLENLVRDLGIEQSVLFIGRVPYDQVSKYYNMLSIYMALSVCESESFGVAVVEAQASGKPVVVSNVGGLPEVIEDGLTGFIVPPRDIQATAAAIERLVVDRDLKSRMGRAGRERVSRMYDWEQNSIDQLLVNYSKILGS